MTSLLRILFPDFDHPETVENMGVTPEPTPEVDLEEFDDDLQDLFDRGEKRAAEYEANVAAGK
jgi:hypothetical protein